MARGRITLDGLLMMAGLMCLAVWLGWTVQAYVHQAQLEESFEELALNPIHAATDAAGVDAVAPPARRKLAEGDVVGRLEIPRRDLRVMVMEGIGRRTLRLGAGDIPGTPLPGQSGNAGVAAHRDTFFRSLEDIQPGDEVRFSTPAETIRYQVVSTKVVEPDAVEVLDPRQTDTLTLVTCFPFRYI